MPDAFARALKEPMENFGFRVFDFELNGSYVAEVARTSDRRRTSPTRPEINFQSSGAHPRI